MSKQKNDERFISFFPDATLDVKIIVDKMTGVQYLWHKYANAGGLTILVNQDGNPLLYKQETPR